MKKNEGGSTLPSCSTIEYCPELIGAVAAAPIRHDSTPGSDPGEVLLRKIRDYFYFSPEGKKHMAEFRKWKASCQ